MATSLSVTEMMTLPWCPVRSVQAVNRHLQSVFQKVSQGPRFLQTGGITKPPLYLHILILKKKKKSKEEAREREHPSLGGQRAGGDGGSPRAGVGTPTGISLRRGTTPPGRQLARGRAGVALAASPLPALPGALPVLERASRRRVCRGENGVGGGKSATRRAVVTDAKLCPTRAGERRS